MACKVNLRMVLGLSVILATLQLIAQDKHTVRLEDLQSLKDIDYLQLSGDGRMLAYTETQEGVETHDEPIISIVPTERGSDPLVIARGLYPLWSPDGKNLAYLSTESGSMQLWVLDMQTMHRDQITNLPGGIDPDITPTLAQMGGATSFRWSPSSEEIIFASRVEAPSTHLYDGDHDSVSVNANAEGAPLVLGTTTPVQWTLAGVFAKGFGTVKLIRGHWERIDARTEPPKTSQLFIANVRLKSLRQLTNDSAGYFQPDWSPDGKTIVCVSTNGWPTDSWHPHPNIYLVSTTNGEKRPLTAGLRDRWLPRWSPDGRFIAYWDGPHVGRHIISVISSKGGEPFSPIPKLDGSALEFFWQQDGHSLVFRRSHEFLGVIDTVNVETKEITPIFPNENVTRTQLTASPSGVIAWKQSDGRRFANIFVSMPNDSPYQLLDPNPQISTWKMGTEEVVYWKNRHGDERKGILLKPYGYKPNNRYPLIVECYPEVGVGFYGSPMLGNQAWASQGYVVFIANPRAPHTWMVQPSTRDQKAARGPRGWSATVDDIMSGVDELIKHGIVDRRRMALYGFSNGGGVVDYLVTRTNRFRCAISVAGVLPDWFLPVFLEGWDGASIFAGGITPWSDPQGYIQLSAVFHLNSVKTPMLLADGDADGGLFLLGMIEMYNGLRALGKDVVLLRYPDQGHGFTGAALRDFWTRENWFLARYLLDQGSHPRDFHGFPGRRGLSTED